MSADRSEQAERQRHQQMLYKKIALGQIQISVPAFTNHCHLFDSPVIIAYYLIASLRRAN